MLKRAATLNDDGKVAAFAAWIPPQHDWVNPYLHLRHSRRPAVALCAPIPLRGPRSRSERTYDDCSAPLEPARMVVARREYDLPMAQAQPLAEELQLKWDRD